MDILIVGVGYVGLVTAACFSEMGHHVICLDIDQDKIGKLKQGIIPFFEPGLQEIVIRNVQAERLTFTSNYAEGISQSSVCFIAVATPSNEDGSCNLSFVLKAAESIAEKMNDYLLIVNKSTVPVGTADLVKEKIASVLKKRQIEVEFDVVSNPEFLKEGSAIQDCMKPDRIVIGAESKKAADIMREIYSAFTLSHDRILVMDVRSSEMAKYAANAMLATRISFMNELAHLCEKVGANINDVRLGIGSDQRIGYQFLYAGIGYGGSCFPKDLKALCSLANQLNIDMPILEAVGTINGRQRELFIEKIISYFTAHGGIEGKTLAIWGLSFKPDTDDMREAPSLTIISRLLEKKANVRVFDPIAMENAKRSLPASSALYFSQDEYDAADGADAVILVTEWKQFRFVNFDRLCQKLNKLLMFDGRNQYKPQDMRSRGFEYFGIGLASNPLPLKPLNDVASTLEQTLTRRAPIPS